MKNKIIGKPPIKKNSKIVKLVKFSTFLGLTFLGGLFYFYGLDGYLSLQYISESQASFRQQFIASPIKISFFYSLIYILVTTFSLPGAAVLTLLAGALFPFLTALIIVSFSSTIGATLAMVITRFLYHDIIKDRFPKAYQLVEKGLTREGAKFLFFLRLVPIFPFFVVNYVFAVTRIPVLIFAFVSQIGMLPGTIVYINAGHQLSSIKGLDGIFSPGILFSFGLLATFPFVMKFFVNRYRYRKIYRSYKKPKSYDANLVVIGGGSAGLVGAYMGAASKAKTILIEEDKMGGDCLNTGCVPSKAILHVAEEVHITQKILGKKIVKGTAKKEIDFLKVISHVKQSIKKIEPHDSIDRYTKLGVECIKGKAKILDPFTVKTNGRIIKTKAILVATGASPIIPDIEGKEKVQSDILTSNSIWDLKKLPQKLLIIGGGAIGCEMSQAFSRLGSKVTLVEAQSRILLGEDIETAKLMERVLTKEGVQILTNTKLESFHSKKSGRKAINEATLKKGKKQLKIAFSKVLIAVGRKATTSGFGLEELGIEKHPDGRIVINDYMQTNIPNVYAAGDVSGPFQLTHAAGHQGWHAVIHALYGFAYAPKINYSLMPTCVYTSPEVASVGLREQDAVKRKEGYEITQFDLKELDRAIVDENTEGFVRVITPWKKNNILGVTIVAKGASNLLLEFLATMKNKKRLNSILGTIHPYPSLGEANKYVASKWLKNHTSEEAMEKVKKFNTWRLGKGKK